MKWNSFLNEQQQSTSSFYLPRAHLPLPFQNPTAAKQHCQHHNYRNIACCIRARGGNRKMPEHFMEHNANSKLGIAARQSRNEGQHQQQSSHYQPKTTPRHPASLASLQGNSAMDVNISSSISNNPHTTTQTRPRVGCPMQSHSHRPKAYYSSSNPCSPGKHALYLTLLVAYEIARHPC